jgi:hypothetical protein
MFSLVGGGVYVRSISFSATLLHVYETHMHTFALYILYIHTVHSRVNSPKKKLTFVHPSCGLFLICREKYPVFSTNHDIFTINAPLILKVRNIIFVSREKHIMVHFEGFFEGAKTFLTPKLS